MSSRMSRYYEDKKKTSSRSEKNENLYKSLYETTSYSNISSVAVLEKTNEIDLDNIRKMIKDRENYKKQREYLQISKKQEESPVLTPKIEIDEDKNYDIRDVLTKAKEERKEDDKTEFLRNRQYDLNEIRRPKRTDDMEDVKESLKEIIHTITNHADLNKLSNSELSLDLLDDLKAKTVTDVEIENSAVRRIIEEEKKRKETIEKEKAVEMDKSFYTTSLKFNDEDFEDNDEPKEKERVWPKILLAIIFVIVLIATIYVVYINIKSI